MERHPLRLVDELPPAPIPFPDEEERASLPFSAQQAYMALDIMNRKLDVLARELNCFVPFDHDDHPTAA